MVSSFSYINFLHNRWKKHSSLILPTLVRMPLSFDFMTIKVKFVLTCLRLWARYSSSLAWHSLTSLECCKIKQTSLRKATITGWRLEVLLPSICCTQGEGVKSYWPVHIQGSGVKFYYHAHTGWRHEVLLFSIPWTQGGDVTFPGDIWKPSHNYVIYFSFCETMGSKTFRSTLFICAYKDLRSKRIYPWINL